MVEIDQQIGQIKFWQDCKGLPLRVYVNWPDGPPVDLDPLQAAAVGAYLTAWSRAQK